MLLMSRQMKFADFRFNVPTRELLRVGNDGLQTPISLGSRAADLLALFLDRPGELITKDEIMDAVWPNLAVEESNLTVQISALRRALDDGRNGGSCIQTVPGRGYRFILRIDDTKRSETVAPAGVSVEANSADLLVQPLDASPERIAATSLPQSVPATSSPVRADSRWRLAAGCIVALFCVALVVAHWRDSSSDPPIRRGEPPRLSIVVLPFVNSSGEQKDDELAAALTEDVTTSLAQLPGSYVVAHSLAQAMAARQLLLPAIGSRLGVRYVLEGNIRRSPAAVEFKVQLSDAERGASIWAAQFLGSGSEARDQIAQSLLFPLQTKFMDAEVRRLSNRPVDTLTADDLFLKVRASYNHLPITPARNAEDIATLERALALDPNSGELPIRLSFALLRPILQYDNPDDDRDERLLRVRGLVDRAREREAGSELMLSLQAFILRVEGRWDEAIAAYTALLQAHPGGFGYHAPLAECLTLVGRSAEAVALLQEAIKHERSGLPRFVLFADLGHALVRLGRDAEAIKWLLDARELSAGFSPQINRWLAIAYAHSGKIEDARRELREAGKRSLLPTLQSLRHARAAAPAAAEEEKHKMHGLALAGLRDHADEDADPGLPITAGLRSANLNAPTPLGAPGVSTIRTSELAALISGQDRGTANDAPPIVLSVVCGRACEDISGCGQGAASLASRTDGR